MAIFRRRRDEDPAPEQQDVVTGGGDDEAGDDSGDESDAPAADRRTALPALEVDRSAGPWDAAERSAIENYIDLGALMLPAVDGVEIRLDVDEQSGSVTAATVLLDGSVVQLQAFAAPRSEGIWGEIRSEIKDSISQQGGTADEVPGIFGYELLAQIPARSPDGRTVNQAVRFTGVDGPRWFLRAVFHGAAAYDADAAQPLEDLVRGVVVVRGIDAMAPRELLALRLPSNPADQAADEEAEPEGRYPLDPFERGPEITEVR